MNVNDADKARAEVERALSTADPRGLVRTLLANAWPLYESHYDLLTRAISSLPHAVVERNPVLSVLNPMAPVLFRTGRALTPVLHPDDARALSPDEVDLLTLVQMVAFRMAGDVTAAVAHAGRLHERMARTRTESRERPDGPLWFFHHQIGSTLLAAGDTAGALAEFATSRQLAHLSPLPYAERLALGRTALAHAARGSLNEAEVALAAATALPTPSAAHVSSSATTERTAAALIAVDRMTEDADALVARLESYDSYEITWPFALLARARALMAQHRVDDALEVARLSREAHPAQRGSFGVDAISAITIEALTAIGDIERAGAAAAAAAAGDTPPGAFTHLACARLALHDGQVDTATRHLRAVTALPTLGPAQHAEALALSTWADLVRGSELDAYSAQRILRLALNANHRRLFAALPRQFIDRVRARLAPADAEQFDERLAGLVHLEVRSRPQLTPSESRVLRAMMYRDTIAAIAAALHVSPNTIKSQLQSLYRKLGCSTREEAISAAARWHLLPLPDDAGSR